RSETPSLHGTPRLTPSGPARRTRRCERHAARREPRPRAVLLRPPDDGRARRLRRPLRKPLLPVHAAGGARAVVPRPRGPPARRRRALLGPARISRLRPLAPALARGGPRPRPLRPAVLHRLARPPLPRGPPAGPLRLLAHGRDHLAGSPRAGAVERVRSVRAA